MLSAAHKGSDNLVFMDGTAHCRDMLATNYLTLKDPPSVGTFEDC